MATAITSVGTGTAGITSQFQTKFSKDLLEKAVHTLQLHQFAHQADLPKNVGGKSIRFFRPVQADTANVQTLTEGTPLTNFTQLTYENIDCNLAQYGEAIKFTDIIGWTSLLNVMKDGITLMGEDCAIKADDITLNAIMAGTGDGAVVKRYSGGTTTYATFNPLSQSAGKFSYTDGLDAMTNLKLNKAPRINGEYIGIASPRIARDLMTDTNWINASAYSAVQQLFKGEVGSLGGVRYVLSTNEWMETAGTENTRTLTAASSNNYATIFTGKGAYGVPKLAGTSPYKPQVIIADKADKSDPLNQNMFVGWKAYYGACVLNKNWIVKTLSKSVYA
jgi:N4-gp56 family major capsid protein